MSRPTDAQMKARKRNHEIMRLRGMFKTAQLLFTDNVNLAAVTEAINDELERRGAKKELKLSWN